jgi:excisionase family DNA binding protein
MLLTEAEAAVAAKVSKKTIRRLINAKRLRATDYGTAGQHNYRIDPADLGRIEPQATEPTPLPRGRRRQSASPVGLVRVW